MCVSEALLYLEHVTGQSSVQDAFPMKLTKLQLFHNGRQGQAVQYLIT